VIVRVLATSLRPDVFWWAPLVMILSGVTMTIGNLVAIPQVNIKRMLAYSSIAQAGYILLGVSAMAFTPIALTAVLIYIFIYLFMNLGAFTVVTLLSAKLGSDHLRDYAGLIRRAPIHAVALAVFLLSLAGIPPTAGFLAKFYLFLAAVNTQSNQILWLTIIALANTVVSIYYYMNVARLMFFRKPESLEPIPQSRLLNFALGLTLAMTFIILLYPKPFIRLAEMSARIFSG
jgi:NADH-quinone oxidoreductase subunit N